jgi:hypothetical protein
MNSRRIEELLRMYYEGLTSLEEEKELREFFSSSEIPPGLAGDAELFRSIVEESEDELPLQEFEEKFLSRIEEPPVIPMNTRRKRLYFISGIAAGLLLLTGLFFTFRSDIYLKPTWESAKNPAEALAQTQQALMLVSSSFNAGIEKINTLSAFSKGIESAQKFSVFNKYQTIIINPDETTRSTNK